MYGGQEAILKVTLLKMNRLLPMATINTHMKFEIEIPKQTWLMHLVVYRQTDGRMDRRTDKLNPVYHPPSNFVGQGYNYIVAIDVCITQLHNLSNNHINTDPYVVQRKHHCFLFYLTKLLETKSVLRISISS